MIEILPNLLPALFTLLGWQLAAPYQATSRIARGLSRGFFLAFVVTFLAAVPAFLLVASNGFRGLEMEWMLTFLLAVAGMGIGLIVFFVGFSRAYSSKEYGRSSKWIEADGRSAHERAQSRRESPRGGGRLK